VITGTTGILGLGSTSTYFISNQGTITGTGGTAIDLSASTVDLEYTIFGTSMTNGTVRGGSGTNTLNFGGGPGNDMAFSWNRLNAGGAADGDDQYFGFTHFVKLGTNVLTLSGGNGSGPARSFTMGGGTTLVSGNMGETSFTVNGGTLRGTGTLGSTSVASGGTLSLTSFGIPGEDSFVDALTINGNLVLNAGSSTRLDVGAAAGSSDRIIVTGTASLAGSLSVFALSGAFTPGTYTLLTANGGRTGTFSPLTTTPVSSAVSLRYDANNVFLDIAAGNPNQTFSFSTRESLVFNPATVTTNRTTNYSTQIIGRLLGGTALYDQTFTAAYASTAVQNGLTAARAAITTVGGPGVIIGDPVRTSSTTTSTTVTGTSTYSLAGPGVSTMTSVTTFGPATILTGDLARCNVSSLPSTTRPTCTTGGTSVTLADADENFNTITATTYTINETRTDTVTDTLREVYELNGQVVAVGTVHAEVQSGLFDLSGRLLGRLAQIEPGRTGWGDVYRFRVSQGGRRDAWGLAGGISLPLGEKLTLAAGIGHGNLDIAVPGAAENGTVKLTELGAALRFDSGGFGASLAVVQGFGDARIGRTMFGNSKGAYDVRATGAALDMGYAFTSGGFTLRPVVGLDWLRVSTDAFTETDTLGLVVGKQSAERVRASAGLSVARDFGPVTLAVSGRYLAVLSGADRNVPVAFALAPTRSLTMAGPSEPDTAMLGARAILPLGKGVKLSLAYDGRFGSGYNAHSGNLGLSVAF
jgi:hypothetical protein